MLTNSIHCHTTLLPCKVFLFKTNKKTLLQKYTFFGSFTLFTYICSQASSCKLIEASFINEIKCNNKKQKKKNIFFEKYRHSKSSIEHLICTHRNMRKS